MRAGSRRIRVLVRPARASIKTSLVINTDRCTYLIAPVVRFSVLRTRQTEIATENHPKLGAASFQCTSSEVPLKCASTVGTRNAERLSWLENRPRPVADTSSFSIPLIAGKKITEMPVICGVGLRRFGGGGRGEAPQCGLLPVGRKGPSICSIPEFTPTGAGSWLPAPAAGDGGLVLVVRVSIPQVAACVRLWTRILRRIDATWPFTVPSVM